MSADKKSAMRKTASTILPLTLCLALAAGCTGAPKQGPADRFGIYTTRLSGADVRLVVSSRWQQMTHPRVSPDGREVAFMRLHGTEGWRVMVVNMATGRERDLSGP